MEKNYQKLLDQLVNGDIEILEIEKAEFIEFRDIWMVHPDKKQIIGEADYNGLVRYHFENKSENN